MKKILFILIGITFTLISSAQYGVFNWINVRNSITLGDSTITTIYQGVIPDTNEVNNHIRAALDTTAAANDTIYILGQNEWIGNGDTLYLVDSSTIADTALYISKADSSIYADTSVYALYGDSVIYSDTADYALEADSSNFADSSYYSDTSGYALSAAGTDSAEYADTAGYALKVDSSAVTYIVDTLKIGSDSYITASNIELNENANTGMGLDVFYSNTSGYNNTAFGYQTLYDNTTGHNNAAIGLLSLGNNTTGHDNIAIGTFSLGLNTDGDNNVGVGKNTLYNNEGNNNIAVGYHSLINSTTSFYSIGLGAFSGAYNTTQINRLYINSLDRTNILGDTTKSIIYGYQDADIANQRLTLNATVTISEGLSINGGDTITTTDTVDLKTAAELETFDTLTIKNINITEILYRNSYEVASYLHPDSTITTSLSTSWIYLGSGSNNKFTNIYSEGFAFDGDTLYFDQESYDSRDSIEFRISYSCESATSGVNQTVFMGIFIKSSGESTYSQYLPTTRKSRTTTASVYYPGPSCSTMPIYLKDGDKIQIQVKCATGTTTLNTQSMGIYLFEE